MELKQQFENVMGKSINMALATSVDDQPNVRVVSFAYDPARSGKVFFTTFKGNQKVQEFAQNAKVALVLLPEGPDDSTQVRIFGKVEKSTTTLDEVVDLIARKSPENAETIKGGGEMIAVYEVLFDSAYLTVGMTRAQKINI